MQTLSEAIGEKEASLQIAKRPLTEDFTEENIYKFMRWFIPPTSHTNFIVDERTAEGLFLWAFGLSLALSVHS